MGLACSEELTAKERVKLFAGKLDCELWQLVALFDSLRELKSSLASWHRAMCH